MTWASTGAAQTASDAGAPAGDAGVGAAAADAPPAQPRRSLKIAVAGSPPFVIGEGEDLRGFSVDVWQAVADRIDVDHELVRYETVPDALAAVSKGEAEIAVGPISITAERAKDVDFTQPYFTAELGILTSAKTESAWDTVKPLMSRAFLVGLASLLTVLLVVGNLIWLAERKKNPDEFPASYVRGVGNGMWFALVTMTTVGYGDRAPRSVAGRVVAGAWMIIAVFAASSITAGITTGLTLSQIDEPLISDLASLARHRVAAVDGTPGEQVARRNRARSFVVESQDEALELLKSENVDAFVYDFPVLRHYLDTHPELDLALFNSGAETDDYGFATAHDDPLNVEIGVALLRLREARVVADLESTWLTRY